MRRLLPDFYRAPDDHPAGSGTAESLNGALRSLHEPAIIDAKRQACQCCWTPCPPSGGEVRAAPRTRRTLGVGGQRRAAGAGHRCWRSDPTVPDRAAAGASDGGTPRRVSVADGAAGVSGAGPHGRRSPDRSGSITDVAGILVGHHHRLDDDATLGAGWATGTTVVLTPPGTVGAVDVPRWRARHPRDRPARPGQQRALRRRRRPDRRQRLRAGGCRRRDAVARAA